MDQGRRFCDFAKSQGWYHEGRNVPLVDQAAFGAVEVYRFGGTDVHVDVVSQLTVGGASFWVEDESPTDGNFSPETVCGCTGRLRLIVDAPEDVVRRSAASHAARLAVLS